MIFNCRQLGMHLKFMSRAFPSIVLDINKYCRNMQEYVATLLISLYYCRRVVTTTQCKGKVKMYNLLEYF